MADIDTIEGLIIEARYFWNTVKGNPTAYQITEAQADKLDELTTAAETGLTVRTDAENNLTTKRGIFKSAFSALAPFFRRLRQSVKENPATTDAQRIELHLATGGGSADLTDGLAVAPLLLVEQTGALTHTVKFFMTGESSNSKKKPNRVDACKIYLKIGEFPTGIKECSLIAVDRKSPYVYEHEPEDIGKQAHYIGVWADDDDDTSPPSETFSITITG